MASTINPRTFLVLGAGGYIATKHFAAIKAAGHSVGAIADIHDSVGAIDRFFPFAEYVRLARPDTSVTNEASLQRLREACQRRGVTDVVICTPNDTHATYARWGHREGLGVLCEKPLARSVEEAMTIPSDVRCVLQLRCSGIIDRLKAQLEEGRGNTMTVRYYTYRGQWYDQSWKGDLVTSGGILHNLGIHSLDVVREVMGPLVHVSEATWSPGEVALRFTTERGEVNLRLGYGMQGMLRDFWHTGMRALRDLQVNEGPWESCAITGMHEVVYRNYTTAPVLQAEALPGLELADALRSALGLEIEGGWL